MRIRNRWVIHAAAMLLFFAGCKPKADISGVVFLPDGAVRRRPTDYQIDPFVQSEALKSASADKDAARYFAQGDFRFVANRQVFPRFFGVPDDPVTQKWIYSRRRFKVIGLTDQLAEDEEFRKHKARYEEVYNGTMYELLLRSIKQ